MAESKLIGSCRIGGELLQQMRNLKPGQVLRLIGENGKQYGLFMWDDTVVERISTSESRNG